MPGFIGWADPWGRLGLWLSLWDDEARPLLGLLEPHPFWKLIRTQSARFQKQLHQLAARTLDGEPASVEIDEYSGLYALCIPVVHRQRSLGAVLACAVCPSLRESETLSRVCSMHELDRIVTERLVSDLPTHTPETFPTFLEILRAQVAAQTEQVHTSRDVRDLSSHLAQSYEELNLIYRLSSNLTVLKRPAAYLEEVCRELLGVSVVENFAAVLDDPDLKGDPHVVQVGPTPVDPQQIIQLCTQARTMPPNAGGALVNNNIRDTESLSWAGDWLRQLVYFQLRHHDRCYGALIALNHIEGREFGSEEIQLMNAVAERSAAFLENLHLYDDLEQLFMGMLHALVSSIDAKDPYTCGHSQRVAWLSRHIGELLGLSEAQNRRIYLSGLLHDVGKIGVAEAVLRKTGRLTDDEFAEMKRHPEIGARILQGVRQVKDLIPGVLEHHERYDGRGYPRGLRGQDISLLGRIIGLADSFDAMTTSRTYRTAHPVQIALAELRRYSGTQFDPQLTDLLLGHDPARLLHVMSGCDRQLLGRDSQLSRTLGREKAR